MLVAEAQSRTLDRVWGHVKGRTAMVDLGECPLAEAELERIFAQAAMSSKRDICMQVVPGREGVWLGSVESSPGDKQRNRADSVRAAGRSARRDRSTAQHSSRAGDAKESRQDTGHKTAGQPSISM